KRYIVIGKGKLGADGKVLDLNGDGKINDADATTLQPTTLIADAHKAGLFVHAFTFRNESRRLAASYNGDPKQEYLQYYALGLDGLFSRFTNTALTARAEYLRQVNTKQCSAAGILADRWLPQGPQAQLWPGLAHIQLFPGWA